MSRPRILDEKLLEKVRQKLKKNNIKDVNVVVSQKASSLGISSESALVLIAKDLGIGVSTYQRKLDSQKQSEIRDSLSLGFSSNIKKHKNTEKNTNKKGNVVLNTVHPRLKLKTIVEYFLEDQQLKERCDDLLLSRTHFDRPVNQATLVLEDRIRLKVQPTERVEGIKLINHSFSGDLSKTRLQISTNPDEQDGFTNILRGVVLAFRNPTHHQVTKFSQEQALKVCGLVDVLLRVVDSSQKIR
ncbi:MAG: TIGR02391 family protein [Candidatus Paceibacterota bacterium]|jgi:uncharacterized protein (TIGR02391 family)